MESTGISFLLGPYQNAVTNTLEKMRRSNIAARIWAGDFNVWKHTSREISNRLGWLHAPLETLSTLKGLQSSLSHWTEKNIRDIVLLGMGGSSLSAEVFSNIIGSASGFPRLHILDTTDPAVISETEKQLDLKQTLFLAASKSGKTLEITSLFHYFYHLLSREPDIAANEHFIFITDEGSPMLETAWQLSISYVFSNNPNIGGRYSALSPAGIIPALLIGIDAERLLQKAAAAAGREKADFFSGKKDSPGCLLGAALGVLAQYGRDKLTVILPSYWKSFGDWLEQLIAESTGKEGKGIVPIINESPLGPGFYGKDRVFVFFENGRSGEDLRIADLVTSGHPVIKIHFHDAYDLGSQMFLWEMATAVASHVIGVHPFDQPDVETTKINTTRMIDTYRRTRTFPEEKPSFNNDDFAVYGKLSASSVTDSLIGLLQQAEPNAYVGIQVFLSPSNSLNDALQDLRTAITRRFKLAVTIGYGPRYLHSTGQLHKGDAGRNLFIQLTGNDATDMNIPDSPSAPDSRLSFGALKAAQAAADRQALIELGRKIVRIHFHKDPVPRLRNLIESL